MDQPIRIYTDDCRFLSAKLDQGGGSVTLLGGSFKGFSLETTVENNCFRFSWALMFCGKDKLIRKKIPLFLLTGERIQHQL